MFYNQSMTNSVFNVDDIKNSLKKISDVIHSQRSNSTFVKELNDEPMLITRLQSLMSFKFGNKLDDLIYGIITSHAFKAEKLSPGGFDECIELISNELQPNNNCSTLLNQSSDNVVKCKNPTSCDVNSIIDQFCVIESMKPLIKDALLLAGFAGRVSIERSANEKVSVETFSGQTFNVKCAFNLSLKKNLILPRIVLIDGYIETVSEINLLLTQAAETKENVLLFARGMSNDVKHTLKVNLDRQTLNVYPILVDFDFDGVNMLADISVVSGSDVLSSLKGDLISSCNLTSFETVESAELSQNVLCIKNRKRNKFANAHIHSLKLKRETAEHELTMDVYDRRIKSMLGNNVVIRLVDDKSFVINSQAIDYSLRAYKSLVSSGLMESGTLTATFLAAKTYSKNCIELINQLSSVVA